MGGFVLRGSSQDIISRQPDPDTRFPVQTKEEIITPQTQRRSIASATLSRRESAAGAMITATMASDNNEIEVVEASQEAGVGNLPSLDPDQVDIQQAIATTATVLISSTSPDIQARVSFSDPSDPSQESGINVAKILGFKEATPSESRRENSIANQSASTTGSDGTMENDPFHLTADQLRILRAKGHIPKLPSISKDEINGRAKGDAFTKAIAVVQIFWNVVQVIVRAVRGLAISQLELAVIAFSLCAITIYILQWDRPKDVQVPVTVFQYNGPIPSYWSYDLIEDEDQRRTLANALGVPAALENQETNNYIWGAPVSNDISVRIPESSVSSGLESLAAFRPLWHYISP